MNEKNAEQLNRYLEKPNGKNFSGLPAEDRIAAVLANELKNLSPNNRPDEKFTNNLQKRLIKNFRSGTNDLKKGKNMNTNWKIVFSFSVTAGLVVLVAVGLVGLGVFSDNNKTGNIKTTLPQFASCQALTSQLKDNYQKGGSFLEDLSFGLAGQKSVSSPTASPVSESNATDYSQTNVQVTGVDEADTVKTDGQYIYTISGQNIKIALAYPVAEAKLVSTIAIKDGTPTEIFIDGENLLVFGSRYENIIMEEGATSWRPIKSAAASVMMPEFYGQNLTFVEIYNLSNPSQPELKRQVEFEGTYGSSRKIGKYVYFVVNSWPDYRVFQEEDANAATPPSDPVPLYRDRNGKELTKADTGFTTLVGCTDVSYILPIASNQYVSVIGLPIDDYNKDITKEVILGSSENIYASLENIYLANTTWQAYEAGILDKIIGRYPEEKTAVYKFSLDKDKIKYEGQAEVPGTILNQFSMDESNDYFRIATTIGHVSQGDSDSTNNIYILDKDLTQTGSLEGIAPGEKFYSTRFMGDRAYLVTFKKVDPFFTVDLSDPAKPKILGQLKIPGYSDYLHPYDDNHIIGVGKDTEEAEEGNFAWYQGLKMAIFDVTDVANPVELFKTVIGDRGTDSPALSDHKAFLFSREKNLLVIPVTLMELTAGQKAGASLPANTYGSYTFQGSYVYDLTLENGFVLKGRVTHYADDEIFKKSGYYFSGDDLSIFRNLYINSSLYSISNDKIQINNLADLVEQGKIDLN